MREIATYGYKYAEVRRCSNFAYDSFGVLLSELGHQMSQAFHHDQRCVDSSRSIRVRLRSELERTVKGLQTIFRLIEGMIHAEWFKRGTKMVLITAMIF